MGGTDGRDLLNDVIILNIETKKAQTVIPHVRGEKNRFYPIPRGRGDDCCYMIGENKIAGYCTNNEGQ